MCFTLTAPDKRKIQRRPHCVSPPHSEPLPSHLSHKKPPPPPIAPIPHPLTLPVMSQPVFSEVPERDGLLLGGDADSDTASRLVHHQPQHRVPLVGGKQMLPGEGAGDEI